MSESFLWRTSPDPGDSFEYPYELEVKGCGQLFTYDLEFETNSDQLKASEWPVLGAVAGLMKKDSALKIRVAGHSDSIGDPEANKRLAVRRAEAVKKVLAGRYGADAGRITTRGWGAEPPLADNATKGCVM
ncbi:MAG: OmpA family protein [Acidobacteria bacterium]|nr:OmpA family protein [Acidobacteriota bacterium]